MSEHSPMPKLITFDGEARSGKGTIVQATKDYLRDELRYKVMLIDAGQVFRVLVVAATHARVDLDNPAAIDDFLGDNAKAEDCVELVKKVYHMPKAERDQLLYTNEVGANSAKIGARPLSQSFKDMLLQKWLRDARQDGYQIVLLDGRALEETGSMLASQGLCEFILGFYFICDPIVGAKRTLGRAGTAYDDLEFDARKQVDELVVQINARNKSDRIRKVQPVIPPLDGLRISLPHTPKLLDGNCPMIIFDTSADMSKIDMSRPVFETVARRLHRP